MVVEYKNNKKKILIVSEPGSGGVRRHVVDLLENINSEKYDVYFGYSLKRADNVFLSALQKLQGKITMFEIKNLIHSISPKHDFFALVEIIKYIKLYKPNLIHCHSSKAGVLCRIAAKVCGINQVIYSPHAYAFQNPYNRIIKKNLYIWIEKILSRYFTSMTINVSYGELMEALKYNIDTRGKFIVINNGVYFSDNVNLKDRKIEGVSDGEFLVGSIARLDIQKNPIEFFKIAKEVTNINNKIKFAWIGNGELHDTTKHYIHDNNLEKNCIILPYNELTVSYLEKFDIFMSSSLYEGYPYTLLDSVKYHIPIIASNVVGNNEIVVNGENGFLYESGDIRQAVKFIEDIYNHRYSFKFKKLDTPYDMVRSIEKVYDSF